MDLSKTIEPDSTQINADDLIAGPVVVTIVDVKQGNAEQPVNVIVAEYPGRAYRPSKSMRRVLVSAWGRDASSYKGRRLELFRNPDIRFGRDVVGGIEIASLSHLEKPLTVSLMVTRGKRKPFTVQPLPDTPKPQPAAPVDWIGRIDGCGTVDELRALWMDAKAGGATDDELGVIQAAAQGGETNAPATA